MEYHNQQIVWFYQACQVLLRFLFRLFFKIKVKGFWHVPQNRTLIIASNHQSYIDPPAVGSFIRSRPLRFMARKTVFDVPYLGGLITKLGAFPIKRGKFDLTGMNIMVNLLKNGQAVLIFPEGTRTYNGNMRPVQPGIGMIAYKAKADILPVYLNGFYNAWPRQKKLPKLFQKLSITYGKPINLDHFYKQKASGRVYREIAKTVEEAIHRLKDSTI